MLLLASTSRFKIDFLLQPHNYTLLYNRLRTILPTDLFRLFSRPDIHADHINWLLEQDGNYTRMDISDYETLTDPEKDAVADMLQAAKTRIVSALENDAQLKPLAAQFLVLPSTRDIKVLKGGATLVPVFTQWGCRSNDITLDSDPLTTVLNRPRVTTADVEVGFRYPDGAPAINKPFFIRYMDSDVGEVTDDRGRYHRGACLLDSTFTIHGHHEGSPPFAQTFTVRTGGAYVVTIPFPITPEKPADQPATEKPPKEKLLTQAPPPEKKRQTRRKKRRWWWWLLLLLLLLLFLHWEKTIYVRVVDPSGVPLPATATIDFHIQGTTHQRSTNVRGLATFDTLSYHLYSLLLGYFSRAEVYAEANGCLYSDTLHPFFYKLHDKDTLLLTVHIAGKPMDFRVVDSMDKQPLPDAKVSLTATFAGRLYYDSATTGPDGRVVFRHVPACAAPLVARAELEGYYPDSVSGDAAGMAGPIAGKRTISLRPIKRPIAFRIIDCVTGAPISNAAVTMEFSFNGKKFTLIQHTNTDGYGKGAYADALLIANLRLISEKAYYKRGEFGIFPVRQFIDPQLFPLEKRTFCLQPQPNPVVFTDVDANTGAPISGASNTITITRAGRSTDTVASSNTAGQFTVAGLITGDKLSILAQHPTDYEPNNTTIQNADAIGLLNGPAAARTIPLNPHEIPPPPPCSEPPQQAQNSLFGLSNGIDERQFDMKAPGLNFIIKYNMYTHPDAITVYCGQGTGGKVLASTGMVQNDGTLNISTKDCGPTTWITIVISTDKPIGDQWDYHFVCP